MNIPSAHRQPVIRLAAGDGRDGLDDVEAFADLGVLILRRELIPLLAAAAAPQPMNRSPRRTRHAFEAIIAPAGGPGLRTP